MFVYEQWTSYLNCPHNWIETDTYIAPQAATAAAVALYVTDKGNVELIGCRLSPQTRASLTAKQPHTQSWSAV